MSDEPVRVDRWLWAARLVKTRALAVEAVTGGHVRINAERIKPSRPVRPGDELMIRIGTVQRCVVVRATARRRGPATEARLLYEETAASIEARERHAAERRLTAIPGTERGGRPTKRDRRRLDAARGALKPPPSASDRNPS